MNRRSRTIDGGPAWAKSSQAVRRQPGHRPEQRLPVILALQYPERYPAVLVMPQCPRGHTWSGAVADFALAALERTVAEYGGDRSRLYLVGQSLRARGAVHLAARYPRKFAVLVERLKAEGSQGVRYTELPGRKHDIFEEVP